MQYTVNFYLGKCSIKWKTLNFVFQNITPKHLGNWNYLESWWKLNIRSAYEYDCTASWIHLIWFLQCTKCVLASGAFQKAVAAESQCPSMVWLQFLHSWDLATPISLNIHKVNYLLCIICIIFHTCSLVLILLQYLFVMFALPFPVCWSAPNQHIYHFSKLCKIIRSLDPFFYVSFFVHI